jgi:hypothetical protein
MPDFKEQFEKFQQERLSKVAAPNTELKTLPKTKRPGSVSDFYKAIGSRENSIVSNPNKEEEPATIDLTNKNKATQED